MKARFKAGSKVATKDGFWGTGVVVGFDYMTGIYAIFMDKWGVTYHFKGWELEELKGGEQ